MTQFSSSNNNSNQTNGNARKIIDDLEQKEYCSLVLSRNWLWTLHPVKCDEALPAGPYSAILHIFLLLPFLTSFILLTSFLYRNIDSLNKSSGFICFSIFLHFFIELQSLNQFRAVPNTQSVIIHYFIWGQRVGCKGILQVATLMRISYSSLPIIHLLPIVLYQVINSLNMHQNATSS